MLVLFTDENGQTTLAFSNPYDDEAPFDPRDPWDKGHLDLTLTHCDATVPHVPHKSRAGSPPFWDWVKP